MAWRPFSAKSRPRCWRRAWRSSDGAPSFGDAVAIYGNVNVTTPG